jgi:hypothetical protein
MKLTKLILEIQNRIKLPAEFNTVRGGYGKKIIGFFSVPYDVYSRSPEDYVQFMRDVSHNKDSYEEFGQLVLKSRIPFISPNRGNRIDDWCIMIKRKYFQVPNDYYYEDRPDPKDEEPI